jgi:hypothetical protein
MSICTRDVDFNTHTQLLALLQIPPQKTSRNMELATIVIRCLCPSIHAIVLDGLKPYVYCLFGKVRNTAWNVVEESVEQGIDHFDAVLEH